MRDGRPSEGEERSAAAGTHPGFVPGTKLLAPRPGSTIVEAPAATLVARAVDAHPLTLVVAPAGSGKTTAVACWAEATERWQPRWLRLDPDDDGAWTLAALLFHALRAGDAAGAPRLEHVLGAHPPAGVAQLATALVNDLADQAGVALVLDDLHALGSDDAMELLETVLDHLPAGVRIVATSRTEPRLSLARRRVRGELAELRIGDLRLDSATVRGMLDLAGVGSRASADRIVEFSGGWAAAVRLAVMRSADDPDGGGPTRRFTGQGGDREIHEFFAQEVIADLPVDLRSFLLDTSLLSDLTPAGCAAVTGRDDALPLLDEVLRRDLFVARFDDGASMLRYHDLFRGFLLERVKLERTPTEQRELHRRAASCSAPGDAIRHLVEAGDVDDAAARVCDAGRAHLAGTGPKVPAAWLEMLPGAQTDRHPWLALLSALEHLAHARMTHARSELEPLRARFLSDGDEQGAIHAGLLLTEAFLATGDVYGAGRLLNELLAEELDPRERMTALVSRLWFDFFAMDWPGISAGLTEAFGLAAAAGSEDVARRLALGLSTEFLFSDHGPQWLMQHCGELTARRDDLTNPTRAGLAVMSAAGALLEGRIDDARDALASATAVSRELGGIGWHDLAIDRLDLAAALASGDHPRVVKITDRAAGLLTDSSLHHQERAMYGYALARSSLVRGSGNDLPAIRDRFLAHVDESDRPDASVTRMVIDALIALAADDHRGARSLLEPAAELQRGVRFCVMTGLPMVELAGVALAAGDEPLALDLARDALDPIAEIGAPGLLLQEGAGAHGALLELCRDAGIHRDLVATALAGAVGERSARPVRVQWTGQTLTAREVEVLRRVVAGDSNSEAGRALFIGERTVKTHMTSILRKLEVTSRTQAAARARELGID